MNIEEWKQKILEEYRLQGCATKGISYSEFETTCIADINWQIHEGVPAEKICIGGRKEIETKNNLENLHNTVKKWLHLKNMNRVDLILATHLSRKMKGTKIWIIFVGGSGSAKSELLKPLDDGGKETYVVQEMTTNTLVSGFLGATDLAPKLHNKTTLIMDMAILLNLKKDDKAKVWAQLRELYDGNARKDTGGVQSKNYTGLNITLIACSTGAIDDQILIHQSLGTRELIYRIDPVEELKEENELMDKVLMNEKYEEDMRKELVEAYNNFLKHKNVKDIEIPKHILEKIKDYVRYLRVMRSTALHDSYTGEVMTTTEPESPTRVLKQFKRIYQCLKSLDDDYSSEKALEILREIRNSSCNSDRIKVMNILASDSDENKSITEISQKIRLGKSSVSRHLNVLWNLKLIDRIHTDTINGYEIFKWKANNHNILTKKIINELKSQDVVVETTQDEVL